MNLERPPFGVIVFLVAAAVCACILAAIIFSL
jgi:hypothetical protein